jgi:uncharacterized protein with PIN domain
MVIDSSALVAIYQLEPERERFVHLITMAASRQKSVASSAAGMAGLNSL